MKKDLIIFGTGKIADVIYYYASVECGFNVVAFSVDEAFITDTHFHGLPVIPFETLDKDRPAAMHDIFIAVGYQDLNKLRATKCEEARLKGYSLVSIISPKASIPGNVSIGENCFIMPPALVHPCVTIKSNVFVWSGAMVGHHTVVEDNCWLTSSCSISGNVSIGANSFLAVNATIGHSVKIGKDCFIGANALVTKDLGDEKVVIVESTKVLRLSSQQFLRMSNFSSL
jgi:sugar O-acyltransferase (sialic acid O-acetyltransferase NeuD family)